MNQRRKMDLPPRTSAEQDAPMVEVASCHPFIPLKDVAAARTSMPLQCPHA